MSHQIRLQHRKFNNATTLTSGRSPFFTYTLALSVDENDACLNLLHALSHSKKDIQKVIAL